MRAQFFITVAKTPHLVVFGKVLQSLHWRARLRARLRAHLRALVA